MKKVSKAQIAQTYAKALYEASVVDNTLEKVFNDCLLINDAFSEAKELYILNNPELKQSQKTEIISKIAKSLKVSKTSENFLLTLVENNRFGDISIIFEHFLQLYHKKQGILEVSVQSVLPLNEKQQEKLKSGLEKILKQKIIIKQKINKDILGGLIIEYASNMIDDSIKGKLNRLEQVMKGNI